MEKFKVGDKVRVKQNIRDINHFEGGYMPDMNKLSGKIVTIRKIENDVSVRIVEDEHGYRWDNRAFEPVYTIQTKYDLKDGDIVTLRNSEKITYVNGEFIDLKENADNTISDLEDFYDDLTNYYDDNEYDVVKVERPTEYTTVYKRDEIVKEMTVEEISKALGYEVKIIKENK